MPTMSLLQAHNSRKRSNIIDHFAGRLTVSSVLGAKYKYFDGRNRFRRQNSFEVRRRSAKRFDFVSFDWVSTPLFRCRGTQIWLDLWAIAISCISTISSCEFQWKPRAPPQTQ